MAMSYFLAVVIGWFLVIMAILLISKRPLVIAAMDDVISQPGLLFVIAFITLILGLILVAVHNWWVMGWPVLITILAWLTLISGIVRLFCPEFIHKMWGRVKVKTASFTVYGVIMLIIGLFLLFHAYWG